MQSTSKHNIQILFELLAKKGIEEAVVMPGSRNAPLSIGVNRQNGITTHIVVDERCGGYIALGIAQKSQKCVAVICTSGTALLNIAPAAAEAYYQRIPLLIISADRPTAWIDQDDSQTIRQNNILSNYVKASFQLPEEDSCDKKWYANRMINEAIDTAVEGRKGPVHINVPIDNPLYATIEATNDSLLIKNILAAHTICLQQTESLKKTISEGNAIWIFGFMQPDQQLRNQIESIAKDSNLTILAESISNLYGEHINNNVEAFFAEALKNPIQIDTVLVSGGAIVSKSAKLFLRQHTPKNIIYIGKGEPLIDTYQHLNCRIDMSPLEFSACAIDNQLFNALKPNPIRSICKELFNAFISQCESHQTWEMNNIFHCIYQQLPIKSNVHLSNGTSVRYGLAQGNNKQFEIYSNRGTSGIDGCTSTAVGCAIMSNQPTTLITGDLCFLYDSNALWNNNYPQNLVIIIINNHGGEIFRQLKGPSDTAEFEQYFVTPQHVNIQGLAAAYGIAYSKVNNLEILKKQLNTAYNSSKAAIIEIEA